MKTQPKIYVADAAIRNAVIMQEDILTDPDEMGIMKEIDVVVSHPNSRMHIEIKYREHYQLGEKEAIVQLCEEADCSILVTKREDDYGPLSIRPDKIYRLPAFTFLYLLGYAEKNRNPDDPGI